MSCPRRRRSILTLPAAILAASLFCGAAAADKAPTFDDSTTVVVVEVPVNVHADGEAVRGLTRDDFEILEGKRQRPLVDFEVVDLTLDAPQASPVEARVPIAARRHFLLFFDQTSGGMAGLPGARQLVETGLHPQDLVGIGVYGRSGAGLLMGFTADHGKVLEVLTQLTDDDADKDVEASAPAQALRRDPLRLMPDTQAVELAREALEMDTGGRGSNAEVYFEMNRSNISQGRSRARAEIVRFSNEMGMLADATAGLDGRKFMVLFSAGFDDDVFMEEEILTRRSLLDSRQGASAIRDLQRMTDRFRKAGWTIQSVDAAGLQEGRGLSGGTSLALLANETGGETYRSFNDLGSAMDQMLDRTSVTYLLTFQADDVPVDGAFHKIKVRLKNGPRGARLLHRPGYYAPKPWSENDEEVALRASADRFSAAEMLLSGETGGNLELSTLATTFRGHGEDADRTYVWLDVQGLDAAMADGPMNVEVFAYALGPDQDVVDFATRSLSLDPAKVGDRLRAGGLRLLTDFALPSGAYDLRLLVRESASGLHALSTARVEVPPLGDAPTLLPPMLLDDELNGIIVRSGDDTSVAAYPFVAGESGTFVPALAPPVRPQGPNRVCLMGYHLTRAGFILNVELFDITQSASGERLEQNRIELVGRSETSAEGLDRLYLNLNAGGLAAGRYEIRASLEDSSGGSSQTVASPFRVAGGE